MANEVAGKTDRKTGTDSFFFEKSNQSPGKNGPGFSRVLVGGLL
jgi:hypothetical protein